MQSCSSIYSKIIVQRNGRCVAPQLRSFFVYSGRNFNYFTDELTLHIDDDNKNPTNYLNLIVLFWYILPTIAVLILFYFVAYSNMSNTIKYRH